MKRPVLLLLVVAVVAVGVLVVSWPIVMGEGSEAGARSLAQALATQDVDDLANTYGAHFYELNFGLPSAGYAIAYDSHASSWGGDMAIRHPSGDIVYFYGHVCGPGHAERLVRMCQVEFLGNETYANVADITMDAYHAYWLKKTPGLVMTSYKK